MTDDVYEDLVASLAAAHLIKQQLKETARQILGEEAASRVHLHDNLEEDGAVDRLVVCTVDNKGDKKLQTKINLPGIDTCYGPGHKQKFLEDCETCGREVGRILTQVLHVGQGGNPSSSTTTALQYRDVFFLSSSLFGFQDDETDDAGHVTRRASGVVRGLRQAGVP
nr:hypothetical protein BaRGS_016106 [Batillaria attramentaria]